MGFHSKSLSVIYLCVVGNCEKRFGVYFINFVKSNNPPTKHLHYWNV